jgi:hypothetical protein
MMVIPLLVKTFKSFVEPSSDTLDIQNIRTINDLNVFTSKGLTIFARKDV